MELIVGLFSFGTLALTIVKIARKHTKWYWNVFPMGLGMCILSWVAYFLG